MKSIFLLLICLLLVAGMALAGEADIVDVKVRTTGKNTYRFDVTVRHADEGWKHYADKWDVVAPDGTVLGTRTLYHPHVDRKPFLDRAIEPDRAYHGPGGLQPQQPRWRDRTTSRLCIKWDMRANFP